VRRRIADKTPDRLKMPLCAVGRARRWGSSSRKASASGWKPQRDSVIFDGALNADILIDFMRRLIRGCSLIQVH